MRGYSKWWHWMLLLLFTFSPFHLLTSTAQEMHIVEFKKLKKGPLNMNHVVTSKKEAILDLKTSEKGFSFMADGKQEVAAEEGEGILTLKVPDKTAFIVVKHADYGQLTWKVPQKKGLRRKKHYTATLQTFSPDKEYKLKEQWVIFEIQPQDAILTVDSTMTTIHGGRKQMYLPIGKHAWLAEAPFHQEEKDTVELTDEERKIVKIALQPVYSYLTVKTELEGCDIIVDGQWIGKTQGTSGHLREGSHRLIVMKDSLCYYDAGFDIGWKEKKTIELTAADLRPVSTKKSLDWYYAQLARDSVKTDSLSADSSLHGNLQTPDSCLQSPSVAIKAPVSIKAVDDFTGIWVNRELKGYGSWEGELEPGFYLVSTEKDGLESKSKPLEIGANVYINDKLVGTTPCVIKDLPGDSRCEVRLEKAGFSRAVKTVKVVGNDLTYVKLELKKRKKK